MSESLLGILLVTLLFLLILVGLLPEVLRWLAERNVQRRQQLVQAVRRLEQELRTLSVQLDPFHSLQAPQYRRIDDEVTQLLAQVQAEREAMAAPGALPFPRVTAVHWAIQHFAAYPRDAGRILYTWQRLRDMQRMVAAGEAVLAAADQELGRLHQMPQQFRQDSQAILQQLQQVRDRLQQERGAGVTALETWEEEYGRLRRQAVQLNQQLQATETISLEAADALGQALNEVEAALARLDQGTQQLQQARLALDETFQRSSKTFADIEARVDTTRVPEGLHLLLGLITILHEETAVLRRNTQFPQATALLADSDALIALAAEVIAAGRQVQGVLPLLADSLTPQTIATLHQQLQRSEDELADRLEQLERQPAEVLPRPLLAVLRDVQTRMQQMQVEAAALQQAERDAAQRLARDLNQATTELNRAWQALQRTLPLAEGDLLAKKYHGLLQQRREAQGRPLPLQKLVAAARELTADIVTSHDYLRLRFENLGKLVRDYPQFVSAVEQDAAQWRCLQTQVAQVKECAMGIQQVWQKVKGTGWLDETHELLDEVKQLHQRAQTAYTDLEQQLQQFDNIVAHIERTIDYVQGAAGEMMDNGRINRVLGMVDMQYDEAYRAATCEQALAALQRAESFVNGLVTGA
ncbi:MAG: hypothetical protein R3E31_09185 [Chloroflexota bacterium]